MSLSVSAQVRVDRKSLPEGGLRIAALLLLTIAGGCDHVSAIEAASAVVHRLAHLVLLRRGAGAGHTRLLALGLAGERVVVVVVHFGEVVSTKWEKVVGVG